MAKKAELLEKAAELKIDIKPRATIAEIEFAINAAKEKAAASEDKDIIEKREAAVAKAGKRSEKSLKEAEEQAKKESRKEAGDTSSQSEDAEAHIKKGPKPIVRSRLERRGKKYQDVASKIDKNKLYDLAEALNLATQTNPAKFDATVETHVSLGVDPRQADQNIRATVTLPHGNGKTIRVAVFAPENIHAEIKDSGADFVGDEEFLKQLDKELLDFDILITTPQHMPKLGKYARLLGPRGLMPNPKSGTVATDVAKAVSEAKAGKVEYRVDKQAIVHLGIGKVSFGGDKLLDNAKAFFASLTSQKPSSLKGVYIKSITISTTMGPGIKVKQNI